MISKWTTGSPMVSPFRLLLTTRAHSVADAGPGRRGLGGVRALFVGRCARRSAQERRGEHDRRGREDGADEEPDVVPAGERGELTVAGGEQGVGAGPGEAR